MEGLKVVTASEMARIENLAYTQGFADADFMENAGTTIARYVEDFVERLGLERTATLLIGKGNNGGDAYVAGVKLLQRGFTVHAVNLFPVESCSPLNKSNHERFKHAVGRVIHEAAFPKEGVIIDGLTGTGFQGKAEGTLADLIKQANESPLPKIAIDIPSGLNGTTGEVASVAIKADATIFLGLPKIGFFIKDGWDHVGMLLKADFGLPQNCIDDAKPEGYLITEEVEKFLPPIKRTRHKYEAGYVLGVAGSHGMPGAALLSSFAALRSGAGIVRLFYPYGMEEDLTKAPLELINEGWDLKNRKRILEESKRAKSIFLGPGMGRTKEVKDALKGLLSRIELPCVLDADALYFLAKHPSWDLPKTCILTPHHEEMKRLIQGAEVNLSSCQEFVEERDVTLVLKGAPTMVFHPKTKPLIIPRGDPGMAKAGTGDVLTGVIAAMLAQKMQPRNAACLGVYLHALAGELATLEKTSYGMVAGDLLERLPEAFSHIINNY